MNIKTIKTFGVLQVLLSGMLFGYLYHMGFPTTGILIVGVLFTAFTLVTHIRGSALGMVHLMRNKSFYDSLRKESWRNGDIPSEDI